MYQQLTLLAIVGSALAQNVTEAPPPAPILLTTAKSGVIPSLPTGTPFAGVETEQGAIINPLPPLPGYAGLSGPAQAQPNQPSSTYVAQLPASMFNPLVGTTIQGSITAIGGPSGVTFTVNITNLPDQSQYGPFPWHIHDQPVPSNGNCTATLGHLDPTNRGELYMCDAANPQTCQVGDLAGKHGGKIATPNTFTTSFTDPYLSVVPGNAAFLGGKGFVIHSMNTSRLICANFQLVGGNGTPTGNSTASSTMMPPASYTGGAQGRAAGWMGAAAVVLGMLVL